MKNRKGFDWYTLKQCFSFRKYHFGLVSVLLGALLVTGPEVARAEENVALEDQSTTALVMRQDSVADKEVEAAGLPLQPTPVAEVRAEATKEEGESGDTADPSGTQVAVEEKAEPKALDQQGKEVAGSEGTISAAPVAPVAEAEASTTPAGLAEVTPPSQEVGEHDVNLEDKALEESAYKILTVSRLKEMSAQEIAQLGERDFGDFHMTQEIFSQLSEEQIRALTFNRNYQNLRQRGGTTGGVFRAATETSSDKPNDGYTTSERILKKDGYTPYIDPTPGRKTVSVIENLYTPERGQGDKPSEIGRQYTFSVSKRDVDQQGEPRYLYVTVSKGGGVIATTTIDMQTLTAGQSIPLDQAANGSGSYAVIDVSFSPVTGKPILQIKKRIDNSLANFLPIYGTNVYTQTQPSVNNTVIPGHWGIQVTKFLEEGTNRELRPEFIQYGWDDLTNYTTRPVDIKGYDLIKTEGNENYVINSDSAEKVGDILYKRTVTNRGTLYRKLTMLEGGKTKVEAYITWAKAAGTFSNSVKVDKDRVAATLPSAREFFENRGNYFIYTDLDKTQEEQTRRTLNGVRGMVEFIQVRYSSPTGSNVAPTPDEYATAYREVTLEPFTATNSRYNLNRTLDVNNSVYQPDDVIYYYRAKTANVYVTYKDVNGNTLQVPKGGTYVDRVTDTQDGKYDTAYDTNDHKPNTIKTADGKTYKLAPAGNYPVGRVEADSHLASSAPVSGKVTETDQTVTYVYQEVKGDVVVLYRVDGSNAPITGISSDGKTIGRVSDSETQEKTAWEGAVVDTRASSTGTDYSTTDNRPAKITTADGKVYNRIEGRVGGNETGKVVEGTTRIVYYYELAKGTVVVHYVNENGVTIKAPVTDSDQLATGTDYNTSEHKLPTFTGTDGKTYELVPAGTYPVGRVDGDNHLVSSAPTTGKVTEGTKDVTYVYREVKKDKAVVIFRHVNEDGTKVVQELERTEEFEGRGATAIPYTEATKQAVIDRYLKQGYQLVADQYGAGKDFNGQDGVDTYYIDLTPKIVPFEPNKPVVPGSEVPNDPNKPTYPDPKDPDAKDPNSMKKTVTRTVTYYTENTDGSNRQPVAADKIATKTDSLHFRRTGTINLVTGEVVWNDWTVTDERYELVTNQKTGSFADYPNPTLEGYTLYAEEVDRGDSTSKDSTGGHERVQATDQDYHDKVIYRLIEVPKGSVIVHYKDTEGNTIKDDYTDTTDAPVGTDYNTGENDSEKPTIIEKDGKKYKLIPERTQGQETGQVVEGNTDVTYVYRELGSYLPYIPNEENPGDRPPVPYDETPENPSDNPPLPHIPGYTPKDPDGNPLKPVDPDDPSKGYVPPSIIDPNDPGKDTPVPYEKDPVPEVKKGSVIVHYKDTEGNTIKDDYTDTTDAPVGTDYNTGENDSEKPTIIEKDGKKYKLMPERTEGQETGQVGEGTTEVTYVYRELGSYLPYIPNEENPGDRPPVPYDETPENPSDNPPLPHIPGYTPKDPDGNPLKPVDPDDPTKGYVPPSIIDPNDPGKDTPVPYEKDPVPKVKKGKVVVHYKDTKGNTIKDDYTDTTDAPVGTDYNTGENDSEKPTIIEKDGKKYKLIPERTEGQETGQVAEGTTEVTYVYRELGSYLPYIPNEENPGDRPPVPYDETPENPSDNPPLPHIPGYTPKDPDGNPLKPVDPDDPSKGYVPPSIIDPNDPGTDTPVPYEKDPVPEVKKGSVIVHYKDTEGNTIKDDYTDTPESPVGTDYNTGENDSEKPTIIEKDGKKYKLMPERTEGQETGQVGEGTTEVTYVYRELGSYLPYVPGEENPGDRPPVPYDETPENPSDNPPLPHIPGYTPKDPDGNPLKPVDPDDPTKGYVPPSIIDPNDPGTDTPVPYEKDPVPEVKKGKVVVHYKDTKGNTIKDDYTDTTDAPVGTDYNTGENDSEKPTIIEKDGKKYKLMPERTEGQETGQVVEGNTDVTYVYRELGSYLPYIPNEENPGDRPPVPYDETPENPSDNPPLPHIPGYTPKDPDGNPLKPVDPDDPTKGYVPPSITDPNDPGTDTPVPYEKDPVPEVKKGKVVVHYKDTKGNTIKDDYTDTTDAPVGTDYNTGENDSEKPTIIEKDGKKYKLMPERTEGQETGKVVEGNTDVTYVYRELGSYLPYVPGEENPGDRPPVPYDETPENPSDNPPLPHIPGYTPKDPDGNPLKPVDPDDPSKGYVPPSIIDPNDPGKDTPVPYEKDPVPEVKKGKVVVHYKDTKGNTIKDDYTDTTDAPVGTDYNTGENDSEKPTIIEKDGKKYKLIPERTEGQETGQVAEGTTEVTYVYRELGSYLPYVPGEENPGDRPPVPYDETPENPSDNPPLPHIPGYTPKDPDGNPLKPVDPDDPSKGYVPPSIIDPNDPGKDTPVPYEKDPVPEVKKGKVVVHYKDTKGNTIKDDYTDTTDAPVGTDYNTGENDSEKPTIIEKDGKKYKLIPERTEGQETGKVVEGNTDVTYVYRELGSYLPYVPGEENPGDRPPVPYDETPENPSDNPPLPHIPGYTPKDPDGNPLKPVDPDDPSKGYVPPSIIDPNDPGTDTPVPYEKDPVPEVKKGKVVVHYKDTKGNTIKDDYTDTPESPVGTDYNTGENDSEKPTIIEKDGKKYKLIPERTEGQETGQVGEGTTEVTYVYRELGSYLPYIPNEENPGDRPPVPYDETPENPSDNPPLPHIPGYTPKDPDGNPLKPVDPDDPSKGYVPPSIIDPNDPGKDTPVPYEKDPVPEVKKGSVIVHYKDTEGNTIKDDYTDTTDAPVGTDYNTGENDSEKPTIIEKDGKKYKLMPERTEGQETGQVGEGTTEVTYVYRELGSYLPYIPNEENPGDRPPVPYDETPENPSDNPPLPHIPGYTPKDPDGNPLKPVDPDDPSKGYVPPSIIDPNDPGKDTPVPYEKDPVPEVKKGKVVVHYKDTKGNTIKDDYTDTTDAPVGTDYNTGENDSEKPTIIEKDGKKYKLIPERTEGQETGKVVEGNTDVTYVYRELGSYLPYVPGEENPGDRPPVPYDETPENPSDNPPLPHIPGYTPKDPDGNPLKPVDPDDPSKGYVPPSIIDPNDPGKDTPVPYEKDPVPEVKKGSVIVHYKDTKGNTIKDDYTDTTDAPVGTDYNTGENDSEKPTIIEKDGKKYKLMPERTEGQETGQVGEGTTEVTYVYRELGSYLPYVPGEENPGDRPPVPYDETPENPSDNPPLPHIPGYTPKDPDGNPLKPVDPDDPSKGYVPPSITDPNDPGKDTLVPYEKDPVPEVKKGKVVVHYKDTKGNTIKDDYTDTPESPVGTDYNTGENDSEKPTIIEKDGKKYKLIPERTEGQETGQVGEGTTEVTYVYRELGSYLPYVPGEENPGDRPPVPYDETPENPSDNPPLPHIPGYTPKDPDGNPLKPVDPDDPSKGYVPPSIIDPNDPGTDTPVPYEKDPVPEVKKGSVIVHYKDTEGNTIKDDYTDTTDSPVGTDYNTGENDSEKPTIIEKDGKKYKLMPERTEGQETGQVVEGNTDVTYVYRELGSYLPYVPGEENPGDRPPVPYDETPENPSDNPPLPHIPGYTPKDPDGNPLKPVDPDDPTKGYVPPSIIDPNDPGKDTPVPYEKDPVPQPTPTPTPIPTPAPAPTPEPSSQVMKPSSGTQELPQTGEDSSVALAALGGAMLLTAAGLTAKKRREEE